MRYKIDHDLHIHSSLSLCSNNVEQTAERMLLHAKENGLSTICVTNHFWDSQVAGASSWYEVQNFEHISKILPLPKADGVNFLFGCETEFDHNNTLGISNETFSNFDFVIIPTTHLHMKGYESANTNEKRAKLWVERLESVLSLSLPFYKIGIAHLACYLINRSSREDYLNVLSLIPTSDLERLFYKASQLGCGIELNKSDMSFSESEKDVVLRPFRIAKDCGCKFYLGSDAHSPDAFKNYREVFERAVSLLDLTENDKFYLKGYKL